GIRVVILGASGFVGRWVARALCAQRAAVYLVVRNADVAKRTFAAYGISGPVVRVDLADFKQVRMLFHQIRPSITFNLAGYGVDPSEHDEETAYQINAHLVTAVCEAIAEVRDPDWSAHDIIDVGSALEYGAIGGSLPEDAIPSPNTLY